MCENGGFSLSGSQIEDIMVVNYIWPKTFLLLLLSETFLVCLSDHIHKDRVKMTGHNFTTIFNLPVGFSYSGTDECLLSFPVPSSFWLSSSKS